MRNAYLVALAAIVLSTGRSSPQAAAVQIGVPATGSEVLRGLRGVMVVVEVIDPDAMRDGLTRDSVQADTERRLRQAGIPMLTEGEFTQTPGKPYLYVRVGALRGPDGLYSYDIDLSLNEEVYLVRDRTVKVSGATTWSMSGTLGLTGTVNLPQVRDYVGEHVDRFCSDYLAANPIRKVAR